MQVDILLGLQWGDEGKGKIVDVLCPQYDLIARFQGGPNAGHTLEFDQQKYVLNTIPSGIFNEKILNLIGNGVVIDPIILRREIENLKKSGFDPVASGKLVIARKAHLILPTHQLLDAASESKMGAGKIGSTLKGIGPTYMDKTGRNGLRVGDILLPDFMERYQALKDKHLFQLRQYDYQVDVDAYEQEWFRGVESLKRFEFVDSEMLVHDYLAKDATILAEGAQGSLLDIEFGTYPFVTSSNTLCAGVCTGLGVAPTRIGEVYGIFKAYCTRVGSGPFPTELFDSTGETLRQVGNEFGATTGRPRRCGWLDLVALKYAVMMNGVTALIMMKSDILNDFDTIKVAVGYEVNGKQVDYFPYEADDSIVPIYREFPGWNCDICNVRSFDEFPQQFKDYVAFIEAECGVPVKIISVGPDREETIIR